MCGSVGCGESVFIVMPFSAVWSGNVTQHRHTGGGHNTQDDRLRRTVSIKNTATMGRLFFKTCNVNICS